MEPAYRLCYFQCMKNLIDSAIQVLALFGRICLFTFLANFVFTRMIESYVQAQPNCECCPSGADIYIILAWIPMSFLIFVVIAMIRALKRKATSEKMELL